MNNNNIQLQLASLKKRYLQNILYPAVIIAHKKNDDENKMDFNEVYRSLEKSNKECESSSLEQENCFV